MVSSTRIKVKIKEDKWIKYGKTKEIKVLCSIVVLYSHRSENRGISVNGGSKTREEKS